jgi:RNA recognition motif-containing protein
MSKKLYVANITYSATPEELTDLFSEFGTVVSVRFINDRETGRPKGFGFVEMSTTQEADSALQALDQVDFLGRKLKVALAIDKQRNDNSRY